MCGYWCGKPEGYWVVSTTGLQKGLMKARC